jgi:hypothetical protein
MYNVNASARWTMGRKSSGVSFLEFAGVAAGDTNTIVQIPIPAIVDSNGIASLPTTIDLYHFVSAVSAGVVPISAGSTGVELYELDVSNMDLVYLGGKAVGASAALGGLLNVRSSAGFVPVQQASGVRITPNVLPATIVGIGVASLPTSGLTTTFTLPKMPAYPGQETDKTRPYIPRLIPTAFVLEISASVAISAVWEHFGALCKWS